MSGRISGKSFDFRLHGIKIHADSVTLDITDNTTTATNAGVPNGFIQGDVSASGEIVVDAANLMLLTAAAKAAGSWRDLKPFTIDTYAMGSNPASGVEVNSVRAYGCKLKISSVLNIDPTSTDKTSFTLPFDVTDPDFVWINGVPYLGSSEFKLL